MSEPFLSRCSSAINPMMIHKQRACVIRRGPDTTDLELTQSMTELRGKGWEIEYHPELGDLIIFRPKVGGKRPRSRSTAALLAFFLGGIGAHNFYMGQPWWGLLYVLFSWTLLPAFLGLIESITLALSSDEQFNQNYG